MCLLVSVFVLYPKPESEIHERETLCKKKQVHSIFPAVLQIFVRLKLSSICCTKEFNGRIIVVVVTLSPFSCVFKKEKRRREKKKKDRNMAKTPSKKSSKKTGSSSSGRKKKRVESYSTYIFKVLKQVHPDTGISRSGMVVRILSSL